MKRSPFRITPEQVARWRRTQQDSRARMAAKPRRARNTGPTRMVRHQLAERSGGVCEFPGCTAQAVHDHHRDARGMGGTRRPGVNALSAQLHLCAAHHAFVESHPALAYRNGWKVHTGQDTTTTPVLTRHGTFPVLLDNHGGYRPYTTTEGAKCA